MRLRAFFVVVILLLAVGLFAQETAESAAASPAPAADPSVTPAPPPTPEPPRETRQPAVLPPSRPNVIYVEGEHAISTNFTKEATLNYGCSNYRALQLNQTSDLHGSAAFYAEYVIYVENDGFYEFWYGGTPPGPKSAQLASYSSPFELIIDGINRRQIFRESMTVIDNYSPVFYWNRLNAIPLNKGQHRIRFEVTQKRGYDARYLFYLDSFFLVRKDGEKRVLDATLPPFFPKDINAAPENTPFRNVEDYEIAVQKNPNDIQKYIDVSLIYSLVGDYLNALKYLRRAAFLEPDNTTMLLLTAKNLLWKGDLATGLETYRQLLKFKPELIDVWTEAGKVSAWSGNFTESEDFFVKALAIAPENLSLMVNLALSYAWAGKSSESDNTINKAKQLVENDLAKRKELASLYVVNGFPEDAVPIYDEAIERFPNDLELYFLREEAYRQAGMQDSIAANRKLIDTRFIPSPELDAVVARFYEKQSMRDKVFEGFESQLRIEPDNLTLRKTLAEVYYWNTLRDRAIAEYTNILVNYSYRSMLEFQKKSANLLELMDHGYTVLAYLNGILSRYEKTVRDLQDGAKNYVDLVARFERMSVELDAARVRAEAEGKTVDMTPLDVLKQQIQEAEKSLTSLIAVQELIVQKTSLVLTQYKADIEATALLKEGEKTFEETFRQLTKANHWRFDRARTIAELESAERNGLSLATFVIGRMETFDERTFRTSGIFNRLVQNTAKPFEGMYFAAFQAALWRGDLSTVRELAGKYSTEISSAMPYAADLIKQAGTTLFDEAVGAAPLESDVTAQVGKLVTDLAELRTTATEQRNVVREQLKLLHGYLKLRSEEAAYRLAEQTYLLRYELGEIYYKNLRFPEAIAQYQQVLEIDPWNISAIHKLGLVYERYGQWDHAKANFAEVYLADPKYGNAAALYNRIAQAHADLLDFSAWSFTDTSKLGFAARSGYAFEPNWLFGIGVNYDVEYYRIYRNFGTAAATFIDQSPSVRLQFNPPGLQLYGQVGVHMLNDLTDNISASYFTANPTLFDVAYRNWTYPKWNAGLGATIGPFYLSGSWMYDWESETLLPYRTAMSYQQADASAMFSLAYTRNPFWKGTYLRAAGSMRLHDDQNTMIQFGGDAVLDFPVIPKPELRLRFVLNGSYSDSSAPLATLAYFTPQEALSAGLTIGMAFDSSLSEFRGFHATLNLAGGYYRELTRVSTSDVLESSFFTNADASLEYRLAFGTVFLKLNYGSKHKVDPAFVGFNYWSLSGEAGFAIRVPELLVP